VTGFRLGIFEVDHRHGAGEFRLSPSDGEHVTERRELKSDRAILHGLLDPPVMTAQPFLAALVPVLEQVVGGELGEQLLSEESIQMPRRLTVANRLHWFSSLSDIAIWRARQEKTLQIIKGAARSSSTWRQSRFAVPKWRKNDAPNQ
jgi:hypothetical protein